MKAILEVGGEKMIIPMGNLLCLRCKHFDIKAYEQDIVKLKRSYSWNACRSSGTVWADGNPVACSRFEEAKK